MALADGKPPTPMVARAVATPTILKGVGLQLALTNLGYHIATASLSGRLRDVGLNLTTISVGPGDKSVRFRTVECIYEPLRMNFRVKVGTTKTANCFKIAEIGAADFRLTAPIT